MVFHPCKLADARRDCKMREVVWSKRCSGRLLTAVPNCFKRFGQHVSSSEKLTSAYHNRSRSHAACGMLDVMKVLANIAACLVAVCNIRCTMRYLREVAALKSMYEEA